MMIQPAEQSSSSSYAFGQWQLKQNGLLEGRSASVQLPPKEWAVLCLLLEAKGEVLTKDDILDRVWQGSDVAEESLTRCIYSLRKILGQDKGLIVSVYGRGYRFAVPVVTLSSALQADAPSLAILPFRSHDWALHAELHEQAVRRLTRVFAPALRLLPSSLTAGAHGDGAILQVFERLAPDYVLAGRCVTHDEGLQLSIELVRRHDHALVHSEAFQADGIDHAVQWLASLIAQRLPVARSQTQQCSSYPLALSYLNGLTALDAFTPDSLTRAQGHLRQCLRLSADYVPAWCALADTWLGQAVLGMLAQHEAIGHVRRAVAEALAVDPDNDAALLRLALLTSFEGSTDAAEALFRRARLNASAADFWYCYAWHQWGCGDHGSALASIETCLRHDSESIPASILRLRIVASHDRDAARAMASDCANGPLRGHPLLRTLFGSQACGQPAAAHSPEPLCIWTRDKKRPLSCFPVFWGQGLPAQDERSDVDEVRTCRR